jgi:chromosomal replication initiation ATPase DnaA
MNNTTHKINATKFEFEFLEEMKSMFEKKTYDKIQYIFNKKLNQNILMPKIETDAPLYTVDEFINKCCELWEIDFSKIISKCRESTLVLMRYSIMYILITRYKLTYKSVAFMLKRRDHTNVCYGISQVNNYLETGDIAFANIFDKIKNIK